MQPHTFRSCSREYLPLTVDWRRTGGNNFCRSQIKTGENADKNFAIRDKKDNRG